MGKVKRLRQKYHASLAKSKNEEPSIPHELPSTTPRVIPTIEGAAASTQNLSGNIFAGLQIKFDEASDQPTVHKTDDMDTRSVSSEFRRSREGSKKERRKRRHEEFMLKIDAIRAGQRAEKERRKREKTVIVGDVHPLKNALPSLEEILSVSGNMNKEKQKSKKPKGTPKQKEAQKEFMSDLHMFMAVNQDPHFNEDPFGAIDQAVKNRIIYAEEDT